MGPTLFFTPFLLFLVDAPFFKCGTEHPTRYYKGPPQPNPKKNNIDITQVCFLIFYFFKIKPYIKFIYRYIFKIIFLKIYCFHAGTSWMMRRSPCAGTIN